MRFNILILIVIFAVDSEAQPAFGRPLSVDEFEAGATLITPDGRGLPEGGGSVAEGAAIYAARCIACHGRDGRGGPGGELAGGRPDLTLEQPDQTIGTYWPYATTLFDFVRRAMPHDAPWSLSDDEVYAVVAYLLELNGLLDEDARLDRSVLKAIEMPNADGFDGIEAHYP